MKLPVLTGQTAKQTVTLRQGIETETGKKLQRLIKDSKLKVQAAMGSTRFAFLPTVADTPLSAFPRGALSVFHFDFLRSSSTYWFVPCSKTS